MRLTVHVDQRRSTLAIIFPPPMEQTPDFVMLSEAARTFYARFDFLPSPTDPLHLSNGGPLLS